MSNLYAVCFSLQQKIIDAQCFGTCGKLQVGAILLDGFDWLPCREPDCPCVERETEIGQIEAYGAKENVILRKLKEPPRVLTNSKKCDKIIVRG